MIAGIHQPQYLPWLGYFDKIAHSDIFILLDDVQFKKNDWQNRNKIHTPQGWQWLTVPVVHDFGQNINETKIQNISNWRQAHYKALILNYSRAPFFNDYKDFFESLYAKEWENLSELNIYILEKMVAFLGIQTKMVRSSAFRLESSNTQRLIDLCKAVGADTYLAGADGHKYMDMELFSKHGITLITQEFMHPIYDQVWTESSKDDFVSHMAVIDLLFNYGDKSYDVLMHRLTENV